MNKPIENTNWILALAVLLLVIGIMLLGGFDNLVAKYWDYYQALVWLPKVTLLIAFSSLILGFVSLLKGKKKVISSLIVVFSLGITLLSLIRLPEIQKIEEWNSPDGKASANLYVEDLSDGRISIITLKKANQPETTIFVQDRSSPYATWKDEDILDIRVGDGVKVIHTVNIKKPVPYIYLSYEDETLMREREKSEEQAIKEAERLIKTNGKSR